MYTTNTHPYIHSEIRMPNTLRHHTITLLCMLLLASCTQTKVTATNNSNHTGLTHAEVIHDHTLPALASNDESELAEFSPPPMRVHFIDIGQGSATLFEFPCAAILVDTGGENSHSFISTDVLDVYLAEFFERRTDLRNELTSLIITHPHIDHTRGIRLIRDHYPPRNVITNGQSNSSGGPQQRMIHRYAAESELTPNPVGFRAIRYDDIGTLGITDNVIDPVNCDSIDPIITILWGQLTENPGWSSSEYKNANNHSVVIRVDYGQSSFLLTGDLEENAIDDLIEHYQSTDLLDVDVYLAGHHGSINGTTTELMHEMSPEIAIISMGPAHREDSWTAYAYGHPRREIVSMLEDGVSESRTPATVQVGRRSKQFESRTIEKAVYATGWDGTIILEAHQSGHIAVEGYDSDNIVSDQLNINTATADQLDELPHIGPARANAIINHRNTQGPFQSVDDLIDVRGIGPATLEVIRPHITVN